MLLWTRGYKRTPSQKRLHLFRVPSSPFELKQSTFWIFLASHHHPGSRFHSPKWRLLGLHSFAVSIYLRIISCANRRGSFNFILRWILFWSSFLLSILDMAESISLFLFQSSCWRTWIPILSTIHL
jgi:hypothetical protein